MPAEHNHRQWVLAVLNRYERRLMRFAARLLHDEDAACDAVQHTFLRLCDQQPADLDDRLALWLFTVCRNKATDLLRKQGRTESLSEQSGSGVSGREPDPADVVERGDLHTLLRELVDELPESQREVIELWLQGFSHREIAQITDRRESYVRLLNHRGLKWLRERPEVRALGSARNEQAIVYHHSAHERRHAIQPARVH